jgi:hypothetical protein
VGQVGIRILRWNRVTEDFQEDCYHVPDIVRDEFQSVQGQVAWVARRGQDTSDHLVFMEHELKSLWVQVRLEQKYLCHLIREHVLALQSSNPTSSCQCPILGDFRQSPIPTLFRDLHSEVSSGHVSPPPLESCSSRDSFVSFWDELNAIVSPTLPPVEQEGCSSDEVEGPDAETSEEEWEDVGEGDAGGGSEGGESVS